MSFNMKILDSQITLTDYRDPYFPDFLRKKIPLRIFTLDDSLFGGKSNFTFPKEA